MSSRVQQPGRLRGLSPVTASPDLSTLWKPLAFSAGMLAASALNHGLESRGAPGAGFRLSAAVPAGPGRLSPGLTALSITHGTLELKSRREREKNVTERGPKLPVRVSTSQWIHREAAPEKAGDADTAHTRAGRRLTGVQGLPSSPPSHQRAAHPGSFHLCQVTSESLRLPPAGQFLPSTTISQNIPAPPCATELTCSAVDTPRGPGQPMRIRPHHTSPGRCHRPPASQDWRAVVPTLTAGQVCPEQRPLTPLTWEGLHTSQGAATLGWLPPSQVPQWKDAVLTGHCRPCHSPHPTSEPSSGRSPQLGQVMRGAEKRGLLRPQLRTNEKFTQVQQRRIRPCHQPALDTPLDVPKPVPWSAS